MNKLCTELQKRLLAVRRHSFYGCLSTIAIQISSCNPQGGSPTGGFTAKYANGGTYGMYPATRSDAYDRQLSFTWCRLPRLKNTIV
eukprot:2483326-Pleurochrysis_carterae.AAC.2